MMQMSKWQFPSCQNKVMTFSVWVSRQRWRAATGMLGSQNSPHHLWALWRLEVVVLCGLEGGSKIFLRGLQ